MITNLALHTLTIFVLVTMSVSDTTSSIDELTSLLLRPDRCGKCSPSSTCNPITGYCCVQNGNTCSSDNHCCSGQCIQARCTCRTTGCNFNEQCCSNNCTNSSCTSASCPSIPPPPPPMQCPSQCPSIPPPPPPMQCPSIPPPPPPMQCPTPCLPTDSLCDNDDQCCSRTCHVGVCIRCSSFRESCSFNMPCCYNHLCINERCCVPSGNSCVMGSSVCCRLNEECMGDPPTCGQI